MSKGAIRLIAACLALCLMTAFIPPLPVHSATEGLNVKDFGAVGDGVTDDHEAIQKAIDAATTGEGGGIIHFPAGTYLAKDIIILKSNITILLDDEATILNGINYSNSACIIFMTGPFTRGGAKELWDGVDNVTFKGGTIDMNGQLNADGSAALNLPNVNSANAFALGYSQNIHIENVTFLNNYKGHPIQICACDGVTVKNCTFKGQSLPNTLSDDDTKKLELIQIESSSSAGFPYAANNTGEASRNITIENCYFGASDLCGEPSIAIGTHSQVATAQKCHDITIHNNTFNNMRFGAIRFCGYEDVLIQGNTFIKKSKEESVQYREGGCHLLNIYCANNTTTDLGLNRRITIDSNVFKIADPKTRVMRICKDNANIKGNVTDITITNNHITNTAADSTEIGIQAFRISDNLTIKGNTVIGGLKGIEVHNCTGDVAIEDNRVSDTSTSTDGVGIIAHNISEKLSVKGNTVIGGLKGIVVHTSTGDVTIDDNCVTDTSTGTNGVGIQAYGISKKMSINGNTVINGYRGIEVYTSTGDITIVDNDVTGQKHQSVRFYECGDNKNIYFYTHGEGTLEVKTVNNAYSITAIPNMGYRFSDYYSDGNLTSWVSSDATQTVAINLSGSAYRRHPLFEVCGHTFFNETQNPSNDTRIFTCELCKRSYAESEVLNVKDFGAVGDGVTDDCNAIQKAIDAAAAGEGNGIIVFPAGNYLTKDIIILKSNIALLLDDEATILNGINYANSACVIFMTGPFTRGGEKHTWDGVENVTFQGGTINMNGQLNADGSAALNLPNVNSANAFALGYSRNIYIKNVYFLHNYKGHPIQICACDGVTVKNCTFKGQSLPNFLTDDQTKNLELIQIESSSSEGFPYAANNSGEASQNITIEDCYFGASDLCGEPSVAIGTHSQVVGAQMCNHITIRNNTFDNMRFSAIRFCGYEDVLIQGNTFIKKSKEESVQYREGGCHLLNIYCANNTTTDLGLNRRITIDSNVFKIADPKTRVMRICKDNANIKGDVTDITITNNHITNTAADSTEIGIQAFRISDNLTIKGNTVIGGLKGIEVHNCTGDVIINNNNITNNSASADGIGIRVYSISDNLTIKGNTVSGGNRGIEVQYCACNISMDNNQVSGQSYQSVRFIDCGTNKKIFFYTHGYGALKISTANGNYSITAVPSVGYQFKAYYKENDLINLVSTNPTETVAINLSGSDYRRHPLFVECEHSYKTTTQKPTCTEEGYTTYTCSICAYSYKGDIVTSLGHDYTSVVTPPTCTTDGYTTYTCSVCNYTCVDDTVLTPGHDYKSVVTPPTCTTNGYTIYSCTVCDYSYEGDIVTSPGHDYKSVVTPPTCTTKGYTTYTCFVCGDNYVADYVSATDHNYQSVVTPPTCTTDGFTTYTCTACKHSYKGDIVPATSHNYKSAVISPTCTTDGYTTYTCTVCGYSYEGDVVTSPGHDYQSVVTPPTCTEEGYTTYTCSVCGDSFVADSVPVTDHTYQSVVTPPTCTAEGYTIYTCTVCKDSYKGDIVPATQHNYKSVVTQPTCTTDGYTTYTCTVCNYSYEGDVVTSLGHDYKSVVTLPTCTTTGYTTYTCAACGDSYVADSVPATDHDYKSVVTPPTCTAEGYTTYTCSVCNDSYVADSVPATGHQYESVVTPPGYNSEGYTTHTCTICGDTKVDNIVPATGFKLVGANIRLGGVLDMNFFIDPADLNGTDYYAVVTLCAEDGMVTSTIPYADWEVRTDYLVVTQKGLAACQMTDEIRVVICNGDGSQASAVWNDSIRNCAMRALEDQSDEGKALIAKMLNYGAAAQKYFNYKTYDLANSGITDTSTAEVPKVDDNAFSVGGRAKGVRFYGASLSFRDKIAVRYYFEIVGNIKEYQFTANGAPCTPQLKDGLYYVEVDSILPQDLDHPIVLTVTDAEGNELEINYCPISYIVRMNEKGSDTLKPLVKALYNYHLAAKAYSTTA